MYYSDENYWVETEYAADFLEEKVYAMVQTKLVYIISISHTREACPANNQKPLAKASWKERLRAFWTQIDKQKVPKQQRRKWGSKMWSNKNRRIRQYQRTRAISEPQEPWSKKQRSINIYDRRERVAVNFAKIGIEYTVEGQKSYKYPAMSWLKDVTKYADVEILSSV